MSSMHGTIPARRGRPRRGEAGLRLEVMLDVASRLFIENGYAAATVDQVATEIGMSKNTIYARYPNKEALFLAVVERIASSPLLGSLTDDDALSLEDGLLLRARAILKAALRPEFQGLYRLLLRDSGRFPEIEAAFGKVFFDRLELPTRRYIANKLGVDTNYSFPVERVAHLFMTTLNAYIFDYIMRPAHGTAHTADRDAREAVTYFLRGALNRDTPTGLDTTK